MSALPFWITPAVIAVVFGGMLALEWARPLRRTVEAKLPRVIRNLVVAGVALPIVSLLQTPLLLPIAGWAAREHIGLLGAVDLPGWLELTTGLILLDYTLWHWHWLNHRVPWLWRFHLVHHVDLDLDASTALRFHFGELILSIPYRALQIIVIGPDPLTVGLWQVLLFASILFHHANIELPIGLERILVRLVVTPRMHGIHHSNREQETNSNWSSFLSLWDYLHGTARLHVPQHRVVIGVPAYRAPADVSLGRALRLPFGAQRADWAGDRGRSSLDTPVGVSPSILAP